MSVSKKIFIISSVLLASVLFFLGIYNISFKEKGPAASQKESATQQEKITSENKNALEKLGEKVGIKNTAKIYALSNEAVMSPFVNGDEDSVLYYSRSNGSVYSVFFGGEGKRTVDDNTFSGLEKVTWSHDGKKVLSRFNMGGNVQYSSYDYTTKKGTQLNGGIEYATWNTLGDQILYKYSDPKTGKKTINTANFDGSNWKKIADISITDAWLAAVPQSSFISFWNAPSSFQETSLHVVSAVGGEVRKIFSGRFGADYLWSPDGTKALVSYAESKGGSKMSLATVNSNGGEFQNLNVPTFVSKCVWGKDSKTLYYAIPSFSSENMVLPNDYQSGKVTSKDTFWKMNITTGKTERLIDANDINGQYDATNLLLSPDGDILFFINRTDGKLYGINL